MWVIRLELAPVRLVGVNKKRKNEADLGFLGVLTFFWFSMRYGRDENEELRAPAL